MIVCPTCKEKNSKQCITCQGEGKLVSLEPLEAARAILINIRKSKTHAEALELSLRGLEAVASLVEIQGSSDTMIPLVR